MSLIGSLEDLGLGDILQIISLSQKSGVLVIRTEEGEGRIVFLDGLVRGAIVKGGPTDLRAILVGGGFLSESEFDDVASDARTTGTSVEEAVAARTSITSERIDSLRRETLEQAVAQMFGWHTGEFSFDVREEPEPDDPPIFVPTGINAQYLAMECARVADEGGGALEDDSEEVAGTELSAHEMFGVDPDPAPQAEALAHVLPEAEIAGESEYGEPLEVEPLELDPLEVEQTESELSTELVEVVAEAAVTAAQPADVVEAEDAVAPSTAPVVTAPPSQGPPPLIAIDADLPALEWIKDVLKDRFGRIHIFQRADLGLTRIRQYLARGEMPLVLVSPATPGDPLSGIPDARDFARRLKSQGPRMTVLWLMPDGSEPMGDSAPADGGVVRPAAYQFRNRGAASQLEKIASRLRAALDEQLARRAGVEVDGVAGGESISPEGFERLKLATASLRDASSRGEVLPLVIRFAGESFRRVAMFVVREGQVQGVAQQGLDQAGGPDDAGLRDVRIDAQASAWIRRVLAERSSVCAAPEDAGDRELAGRLGDTVPEEAYLAPIESAGQIIALLYADNLPQGNSIGDTSPLEVVLHHAGLALDRAALERALAEAEGEAALPHEASGAGASEAR